MRNVIIFTLFFLAKVSSASILYDQVLGPVHLYTGMLKSIEQKDVGRLLKLQEVASEVFAESGSADTASLVRVSAINSSLKDQVAQKLEKMRKSPLGEMSLGEVYDAIVQGVCDKQVDPEMFSTNIDSLKISVQLNKMLSFFYKDETYLFLREGKSRLDAIVKMAFLGRHQDVTRLVNSYNDFIKKTPQGEGVFILNTKLTPLCSADREILKSTLNEAIKAFSLIEQGTRIGDVSLYLFIQSLEELSFIYKQFLFSEIVSVGDSLDLKGKKISKELQLAGTIFFVGAIFSHLLIAYKALSL